MIRRIFSYVIFALCTSSLVRYILRSLAHFQIRLFIFLLLTSKSYLYFLDNCPLSAMSFVSIFSKFVAYLLILLSNKLWQASTLGFKSPGEDFRPRWRHRWIHCASSHNQKKDNNLKTKTNQNRQKIQLYGSPTTKEIKKKHSSRLVGGVETGSWAERTHSKAAAGRPSEVADCGVGRAKLQLAGEAAAGGPGDRPSNPGLQLREIKFQTTD